MTCFAKMSVFMQEFFSVMNMRESSIVIVVISVSVVGAGDVSFVVGLMIMRAESSVAVHGD